jgi:hypothetical protein
MERMIACQRYVFHCNVISKLNLSQKRPPLPETVQSTDGDAFGLTERSGDHEKLESSVSAGITKEFSDEMPGEEVCSDLYTNGPRDTTRGHDNAYRPPTGVEVRTIKAAQELFMSNSFKLQVRLIPFCVWCYLTVMSAD